MLLSCLLHACLRLSGLLTHTPTTSHQDRRHYPSFMQCVKRAWVHGCGGWARIVIFWVGCGVATVIVVSTILTNSITWYMSSACSSGEK